MAMVVPEHQVAVQGEDQVVHALEQPTDAVLALGQCFFDLLTRGDILHRADCGPCLSPFVKGHLRPLMDPLDLFAHTNAMFDVVMPEPAGVIVWVTLSALIAVELSPRVKV